MILHRIADSLYRHQYLDTAIERGQLDLDALEDVSATIGYLLAQGHWYPYVSLSWAFSPAMVRDIHGYDRFQVS